MTCSKEQYKVCRLLDEYNVIVNSNPGSGKTTTALSIGRRFQDSKILLITYSSHLKHETRQKLKKKNVRNISAHSYHSFFVNHYDKRATNDLDLEDLLGNPPLTLFSYDIIIIDECQDMTPLYFRVICQILRDNQIKNPKLCLLGDELQNIYSFKDSDERFLTMASKIFPDNGFKWKTVCLQTSYRLTHEIANFINKMLYNEKRKFPILAERSGPKPCYYMIDCFSQELFRLINRILDDHNPQDIFVLCPSLRSDRSPVKLLENSLKQWKPNVPIYVPMNDDESLTEGIMKNKLVFATFHQSKGRERPVSIVLNFDESYTTFNNRDPKFKTECPNELNVACSRSTEKLILIHDIRNKPLPFLNLRHFKSCVELYKDEGNLQPTTVEKNTSVYMRRSCTDFIRFVPDRLIRFMMENITIHKIRTPNESLYIKSSHVFNYHGIEVEEDISALIGTTIPIMFEYKKFGYSYVYNTLKAQYTKNSHLSHFLFSEKDLRKWNTEHWMCMANLWNYHLSKYYFKLYQINDYSFARKNKNLKRCLGRMMELNFSNSVSFEENLNVSNLNELPNTVLTGSLDCVDWVHNIVYEFKWVDKITHYHILQTCVYMYMTLENPKYIDKKWFIYNIKTDELLRIEVEPCILRSLISQIYQDRNKDFTNARVISDKQFIERCCKVSK
jgi:hypothetical protein